MTTIIKFIEVDTGFCKIDFKTDKGFCYCFLENNGFMSCSTDFEPSHECKPKKDCVIFEIPEFIKNAKSRLYLQFINYLEENGYSVNWIHEEVEIWDLDREDREDRIKMKKFIKENNLDKGTHKKFKVGQLIRFMTGANKDILAQAKIKGIDGEDIYVYNDSYWYPIKDNEEYSIKIIKES